MILRGLKSNTWPATEKRSLIHAFEGFALLASSTVETAIAGGIQLPHSGFPPVGALLRAKIGGSIGVTATPTFTFRVRYGTTNFRFTGTIASWVVTPSNVTSPAWWELDFTAGVRIDLSNPVLLAHGSIFRIGGADGTSLAYRHQGTVTETGIALTENLIDCTGQWSVSHASNVVNVAYHYWWYELPDYYSTNIESEASP